MEPYQHLEAELATWAGCKPEQMVACNSGTAALHLALEAFKLPPGSEVLVPDFTFIACARAVTMAGLKPVFVDCDERLLMDLDNGALVEHNQEAIMVVHVYGRKFDVDELHQFYDPEPAPPPKIIEDLAEAHGVKPHPRSDAACWSFYKNKIISAEEGGAVMFKNVEHANLARLLRSQGNKGDWVHIPRAYNYRMTDSMATQVLNSLRMFEHNLQARKQIEAIYDCYCPLNWRMPSRDVPWMYDIRISGLLPEQQLKTVRALQEAGITGARVGFKPMHSQQEYVAAEGYEMVTKATAPLNSTLASCEVIVLPIQPGVTNEANIKLAFQTIRKALE